MGITTYAQNFEDVMLARALEDVPVGFYIDIGAQHPVVDSVSQAFFEKGWRGIHVEPVPKYAELLREARPGDEVIKAAVSDKSGLLQFFEIAETGLSTVDPDLAERHRREGFTVREICVASITLDELFARNASEIHWLKIDVEGHEREAIVGWQCDRRPWILLVESTVPLSRVPSEEAWQELIFAKGYRFTWFDGLNRFYVHESHLDRLDYFLTPPNLFDGFTLSGYASSSFAANLNKKLSEATNALQSLEASHVAEMVELGAKYGQDLRAAEEFANQINDPGHRLIRLDYSGAFAAQGARLDDLANQIRIHEENVIGTVARHVSALESAANERVALQAELNKLQESERELREHRSVNTVRLQLITEEYEAAVEAWSTERTLMSERISALGDELIRVRERETLSLERDRARIERLESDRVADLHTASARVEDLTNQFVSREATFLETVATAEKAQAEAQMSISALRAEVYLERERSYLSSEHARNAIAALNTALQDGRVLHQKLKELTDDMAQRSEDNATHIEMLELALASAQQRISTIEKSIFWRLIRAFRRNQVTQ
jgi:FkbM family methyltransferase